MENAVYPPCDITPRNIAITFNRDVATEMNFLWTTRGGDPPPASLTYWDESRPEARHSVAAASRVRSGYVYHSHHGLGRPEPIPPVLPEHVEVFAVHRVRLSGLAPDTAYGYELGGGGELVGGTFRSGKREGDFTFAYLSDAQALSDENFMALERTAGATLKRAPEAGFFVMPGDLVDIGNSEDLWTKFFHYSRAFTRRYPLVAAIGNHETDLYETTFSEHFNFPVNENPLLPDYVYAFDYGQARFAVLSTELWAEQYYAQDPAQRAKAVAFIEAQKQLLRDCFAQCEDKWKIVVMHKALYTCGPYTGHTGTILYKQEFEPLFDELSVDAVLQGHDHTFTKAFVRGGKAVPGADADTTRVRRGEGTFYLLSGASGQKFYNPLPDMDFPELLRYGQTRKQMYTIARVSAGRLRFETYVNTEAEDELYDLFEICR